MLFKHNLMQTFKARLESLDIDMTQALF